MEVLSSTCLGMADRVRTCSLCSSLPNQLQLSCFQCHFSADMAVDAHLEATCAAGARGRLGWQEGLQEVLG